MDDTLNQFRRRLAQINGIKLNEADNYIRYDDDTEKFHGSYNGNKFQISIPGPDEDDEITAAHVKRENPNHPHPEVVAKHATRYLQRFEDDGGAITPSRYRIKESINEAPIRDSGIQIKTPIHSGPLKYLENLHKNRYGRDTHDMHVLYYWPDGGKATATFVPKGEPHPYDKIK
jgi:hypothetical protein